MGKLYRLSSRPTATDFEKWILIYKDEFPVDQQGFMTFAWDEVIVGNVRRFQDSGFILNESLVMRLTHPQQPDKLNERIEVRPFTSESDWQQLKSTQWIPVWPLKASQQFYFESKLEASRILEQQGFGKRFGAFIDGVLVGDLGIYHKDGMGRFNNVSTHPDYRNQGVCRTLVYIASEWMLKNGCQELVMKAAPNEYSYKIYEKVGFETVERSYTLIWQSPGL